jgi:hypothetical protein
MDMRVYYRKVREQEDKLTEEWVVVLSKETPDGGRAGVPTEVSRRNAARLLVEGRAELANAEEAEKFRQLVRDEKAAADEKEASRRMEFTFVPAGDARKGSIRPSKA